ncbi:MAG: IclR family transcriptional regulator [Mesorhizobium sp.]|nr:MAG: IclR family transcriptional regulator [Mesorhizobium sp.]
MDKAFIKGLRLLEALALSEQPRGVTDLAAELKLTKSNVHRLLTTLQTHGYVRQIPPHSTYGARAPAYTVATGKAMLAQLPDSYLERFRPQLKRYTETTRTAMEELRADVELARAQGYAAVLHGEWREGIAACACAILGRNGELVGAIGMSGPDTRIKRKQIKQYSVDVIEAARSISIALGYSPRG